MRVFFENAMKEVDSYVFVIASGYRGTHQTQPQHQHSQSRVYPQETAIEQVTRNDLQKSEYDHRTQQKN